MTEFLQVCPGPLGLCSWIIILHAPVPFPLQRVKMSGVKKGYCIQFKHSTS